MTHCCEKGVHLCPTGERLWRAYRAAKDIEGSLFTATIAEPDDAILFDRWRMAGDVRRTALRKYERHVDGEATLTGRGEPESARVAGPKPFPVSAEPIASRKAPEEGERHLRPVFP